MFGGIGVGGKERRRGYRKDGGKVGVCYRSRGGGEGAIFRGSGGRGDDR